jgi:hypothetical protein
MHYDLGYFDLEQKTLQPLDNPFGTRVSPMSWYDLLPMSPGWTLISMAEGEELESNLLQAH